MKRNKKALLEEEEEKYKNTLEYQKYKLLASVGGNSIKFIKELKYLIKKIKARRKFEKDCLEAYHREWIKKYDKKEKINRFSATVLELVFYLYFSPIFKFYKTFPSSPIYMPYTGAQVTYVMNNMTRQVLTGIVIILDTPLHRLPSTINNAALSPLDL